MSQQDIIDLRSLDKGESGRTFNYLEIFSGLESHPENPLRNNGSRAGHTGFQIPGQGQKQKVRDWDDQQDDNANIPKWNNAQAQTQELNETKLIK